MQKEGLNRVATVVTDPTRFRHSTKIKKEKSLTASRYVSDKKRSLWQHTTRQ